MRMMIKTVAVLLVMLAAASCRKTDFREVTLDVPGLKNEACAGIVRQTLMQINKEPGMNESIAPDGVTCDVAGHTVTVTFDSMKLATKNLESALADVGFAAGTTPADAAAYKTLPPECK